MMDSCSVLVGFAAGALAVLHFAIICPVGPKVDTETGDLIKRGFVDAAG